MDSSALNHLCVRVLRLPEPTRPSWLGSAALGLGLGAVALGLGLGTVALGKALWRRVRRRWRRRRQVGTVAQLWIYPVKSCKGVAVSEAECTALGLRSGHLRDRYRWLRGVGMAMGSGDLLGMAMGTGGRGVAHRSFPQPGVRGTRSRERVASPRAAHPGLPPAVPGAGWLAFHLPRPLAHLALLSGVASGPRRV